MGLECPLTPHISPVKLSMPLFEEEGREVILTFALLMIFFSLGHRRGLLPEQADIVESHAAKSYSSWGGNLLWIKPRPQSGLVLISLLLCSQTEGVLLITAYTFEGSLQFNQFQVSIIIKWIIIIIKGIWLLCALMLIGKIFGWLYDNMKTHWP